jgi:exodeoxyribonuclease V gamma subunit
LLEKRLQVKFKEEDAGVDDRESFRLDALERYQLGQALIETLLSALPVSEALAKARAAGRLPHGLPGQMAFEEIQAEAEDIAAAVQALRSGDGARSVDVSLQIPPYMLTGQLNAIFPAGQVVYRYALAGGPDLIGAWLRHLVWCRLAEKGDARLTWLVTRDGLRQIRPPERTEPHLAQLLALYARAGHGPVPLFPRSSWRYAVLRFEKGYGSAKALERVRADWERAFGWPGESTDPYIQYCFHDRNPLDDVFAATAEALYEPILAHTEKVVS